MARRKRRKFTAEFKAETVRLIRESGSTVAEVARDLDLTESAVRDGVQQAENDAGRGPVSALTTAERQELRRLRQENRRLRMERRLHGDLRASARREAREIDPPRRCASAGDS